MLDRRQFLCSMALLHPAVRTLASDLVPGLQLMKGRERQTKSSYTTVGPCSSLWRAMTLGKCSQPD